LDPWRQRQKTKEVKFGLFGAKCPKLTSLVLFSSGQRQKTKEVKFGLFGGHWASWSFDSNLVMSVGLSITMN
jgi:hypothetical protein